MPFSKLPDVEPTLRSPSKKKPSTWGPFCAISKRNGTSALLATMTASHKPGDAGRRRHGRAGNTRPQRRQASRRRSRSWSSWPEHVQCSRVLPRAVKARSRPFCGRAPSMALLGQGSGWASGRTGHLPLPCSGRPMQIAYVYGTRSPAITACSVIGATPTIQSPHQSLLTSATISDDMAPVWGPRGAPAPPVSWRDGVARDSSRARGTGPTRATVRPCR